MRTEPQTVAWIVVATLGLMGCSHSRPRIVKPAPVPLEGSSSEIQGTIVEEDSEQAAANALVIVQSLALPQTRETQTNEQGRYLFGDLPEGTYTVQVLFGQADVSKVVFVSAPARYPVDLVVDPEFEARHRCCCCIRPRDPWESLFALDEQESRLMDGPPTFHRPRRSLRQPYPSSRP